MDEEETVVVFRRWRDNGVIIALFPAIPSDVQGWFCLSYERVGQHGGADYHGVIRATKPATNEEIAALKTELTRIGYRLVPRQRAANSVHRQRIQEAAKFRCTQQVK